MKIVKNIHTLPKILNKTIVKLSSLFTVEQLDLEFSNGVKAKYERIQGGNGAVLVVPFDGKFFYMTREYCCGTHSYELGFVKGKIDKGESSDTAALRELQEEIGYGAHKISLLKGSMTVAPGMLSLLMYVYLCEDLYEHKLDGDEPEPIEIVKVSIDEARALIFDENSPLREARSIASLTLALHYIGEI